MNAGIEEDSSYDETVINEAKSFHVKYDDYLSEEDQTELLQWKEFINSLFSERNCFNGNMTVMSNDDQFVINVDNEKLFLLNGQLKSGVQITEIIAEMEDQNSILMKDEEIVTAGNLTCERKKVSEDSMNVFSDEVKYLWHELSLRE